MGLALKDAPVTAEKAAQLYRAQMVRNTKQTPATIRPRAGVPVILLSVLAELVAYLLSPRKWSVGVCVAVVLGVVGWSLWTVLHFLAVLVVHMGWSP